MTAPVALAAEQVPGPLTLVAMALIVPVLAKGLWTVPAGWPLVYWIVVALPLSLWASPVFWQVSWPYCTRLGWSMALCFFIARRHGGRRHDGARLRVFLAGGTLLVLAYERFHPNELAGLLVLFLPLTVAMAVSPALAVDRGSRRLWRLQLALLAAGFGFLLLRTGSRAGVIAATLAVAAVLWLSGRRGRWWLATGAVAAAVAMGFIGFGRVVDRLLFSGSVQGFTLGHMLSGRLDIWHRATHAMADFPFTGLGLGAFGASIQALYPSRRVVLLDDAHHFFLQTALDLGILGLVAFLLFLGLLVWRLLPALRVRPVPHGLRRARLLGLLGSLVAHLLYSSVDSVSLGSPGGVAFWFLCGLILASTRSLPGRPPGMKTVAVSLLVLALAAPWLAPRALDNRAAVAASRALVGGGDPDLAMAWLEGAGCRARWLLGLVAPERPPRGGSSQRQAWASLIECSPDYFDLLQVVARHDRPLAELAVAKWPEHAEAHFWLARAVSGQNRDGAVVRYRHGLELEPSAAQAWIELANLLTMRDDAGALVAYLEACRRSDPGANACLRAGQTAERLGEIEDAIRFYRMSRWRPARDRADELEQRQGR